MPTRRNEERRTMNATLPHTKRRGTKDANGSAGQTPTSLKPNQGEAQDAFLARAKAAGMADAAAQAAWKAVHPENQNTPKDDGTLTEDAVKNLLNETITSALKSQLPEHLKTQVTPDAIREIIAQELAKLGEDSKKITPDQIKSIAEAAAKAGFENIRRDRKGAFDQADASGREGGQIEIPFTLCKGNLPLHMKQLSNVILRRPMNEGVDSKDLERGKAMTERFHAKLITQGCKALTSTGAGSGDEFVPHDLSAELQRRFYLASELAQIILAREIQMPTDPFSLPLSTTRPTFYLNNTENSAQTASDPGTGKVTLTTARLAAKVLFSYEVDEDSIVAILPWIQEQLGLAAADAYENVLVNGDTAATHQDSDITAANDQAKAWNGLRKLALAVAALKVDFSTGGLNAANTRALIKALGKYAVDKRNLIWLCGIKGNTDLLGIAEVLTQDKFGPKATIATGQLANLYGIPIVTSARVREDLNASGVFDNTTTTKGSLMLTNITGFLNGRRREFTLETDRDIDKMQTVVVASFRRAFQPVETPSASISTVAIGYNYNS
jgi:HK97 family phage major capsid protein